LSECSTQAASCILIACWSGCRCTGLVSLRIDVTGWSELSVTLAGRGVDCKAQVHNLRQQLTALQQGPVFLAPSSWAEHGCLTQYHHSTSRRDIQEPGPFEGYLQHALQTPSLQHLSLPSSCPQALAAARIANMPHLVRLQITTDTPTSSNPLFQALHTAVPLLQHLHIIAVDMPRSTQVLVPNSWSQLSRLTSFHLSGGYRASFDLRQLLLMPSLQNFNISIPSTGSFWDLTALTSATSLTLACAPECPDAAASSHAVLQPPPAHSTAAAATTAHARRAGSRMEAATRSVAVPAEWRRSLQQLELVHRGPLVAELVPQLHGLRTLCAGCFVITPEFCRWVMPSAHHCRVRLLAALSDPSLIMVIGFPDMSPGCTVPVCRSGRPTGSALSIWGRRNAVTTCKHAPSVHAPVRHNKRIPTVQCGSACKGCCSAAAELCDCVVSGPFLSVPCREAPE
jgi:hypothetical protein